MMMKRIMIDRDRCMGCKTCVLACMAYHGEKVDNIYNLDLSDPRRESMHHIEMTDEGETLPIVCRHCDEPQCVMTCMSGAMTKNDKTGYVEYDPDQCASCFMCVMSCPYGVLKPHIGDDNKILKCDMCGNRETPRCVEVCPTNTLYLVEVRKK